MRPASSAARRHERGGERGTPDMPADFPVSDTVSLDQERTWMCLKVLRPIKPAAVRRGHLAVIHGRRGYDDRQCRASYIRAACRRARIRFKWCWPIYRGRSIMNPDIGVLANDFRPQARLWWPVVGFVIASCCGSCAIAGPDRGFRICCKGFFGRSVVPLGQSVCSTSIRGRTRSAMAYSGVSGMVRQ